MSVGAAEETEKPESTSKKFTSGTDESAFTQRHYDLSTTRVYLLRPPKSLSSTDRPWIMAHITTADYTLIFRHPLTSKHHSFNLPPNFHISILNPITLSAYYAFREPYSVDKLLVLPTSPFPYESIDTCTLFSLYGGGQLQGCPRYIHRRQLCPLNSHPISPWVKLTNWYLKFDDIIDFQNKVYAIDRQGITNLVNHYKTVPKIRVGKTLIFKPLTAGSGQFGWRKRFAVNGETLYVVVRTEEKLFKVFRLKSWVKTPGKTCYYWDRVKRFKGNKVLFMARDHYFFRKALRKFPGREYRNCIVFSEAAFPQYGNGCWEFTQCDDTQFSEDDIAVFRLGDEIFAREEEWENSGFPKIDWSPPDWIFNVSSFPADEFKKSESSSLSVREPDDDDDEFDFDTGGKNDGEVQSNLKNSKSKDEEEQEEMQSDLSGHDQDQGVVESDSESKDQEDEKMQCDEEMHSKVNIEGDEPLQKDPVTPSRFAVEEEVRRTLVRMNSGNEEMEEETSGKNITHAISKACTSSKTEETEMTPESTSKKFTHRNNELAFPQRPYHHYTTKVCLLQPPKSLSSLDRFWIVAFEIDPHYENLIFRHPLTSKPHSVTLPENFYFPWLKPFTFSTYYAFEEPYSTDKLLAL